MVLKIKHSTKVLETLFLFLIFIGIFFRIKDFGVNPTGLYWDEVAIAADAVSISKNSTDLHSNQWLQPIFPSYGDYKLPVYIWASSLIAFVTSNPETISRLPSLLAGILTILLTGFIAVKLFKPTKGKKRLIFLLGCLIIAISPTAIHFSRVGFEAHLGQMLLALAVYLALQKKVVWQILAQIMAVLATYTYYSVRFIWPVLFFVLIIIQIKKIKLKNLFQLDLFKLILKQLLLIAFFFLLLLPMINSTYYQDMQQFRLSTASVLNITDWAVESNIFREKAGNNFIDRLFFHRNWLMIRHFFINFSDNISLNTLFVKADQNLRHNSGRHGLFFLSFLPFFFYGIFELFRKNKPAFILLTVWWLASQVPASVPLETPHSLRSLNGLVPLSLIITFGLIEFFKNLSATFKQKICNFSYGLLIGLIALHLASFYHYYFSIYHVLSADDWQAGYKQEAIVFCEEAKSNEQIYINHSDHRFFLWMLTYCDFSDQEFSDAKWHNYQLKNIGNINF